jgi:hypothetical protein
MYLYTMLQINNVRHKRNNYYGFVHLCCRTKHYVVIVVYLTSFFVNWAFLAHECQKRPNLHTNELNTMFFCSTSPLKAPNRLKPLTLA